MAAMRFRQVQRFILAKKIFWGYGHFKRSAFQKQQVDSFTNGFLGLKSFRDFRETGPRNQIKSSPIKS